MIWRQLSGQWKRPSPRYISLLLFQIRIAKLNLPAREKKFHFFLMDFSRKLLIYRVIWNRRENRQRDTTITSRVGRLRFLKTNSCCCVCQDSFRKSSVTSSRLLGLNHSWLTQMLVDLSYNSSLRFAQPFHSLLGLLVQLRVPVTKLNLENLRGSPRLRLLLCILGR